ncbi:MAG: winged helix-turn-helix transcriptional regulator [Candidatus Heimdallarchaeota archaeon]|nr:winged helix-turn-helix transcriptional regulator [Candidatus Heimdallarchaeota archaeon]
MNQNVPSNPNNQNTINQDLIQILTDETKLSILMALHYFDSLNLTQLSRFTQKTKPTMIHHIKGLAEQKLIELDQTSITSPGKYYTLSDLSKSIFSMTDQSINDLDWDNEEAPLTEKEYNQKKQETLMLSAILRTFSLMIRNNAFFAAQYLEDKIDVVINKQTGKLHLDPLDIFTINIDLINKDQEKRLQDKVNDLIKTIFSIIQENNDRDAVKDVNYPHKRQFISYFSAPINLMKEIL